MKRILSIILAILLVTALGATTVFAAGEGASLTSTTGAPGEIVYVDLSLEGFEDADTIGVTVCSDTLMLDTGNSRWELPGQLKQIQSERCVWGSTSGAMAVNGKIMTLAFQIPAEGNSHSVRCEVIVKNGSEVLGEVSATGTVDVVIPVEKVTLNTSNLKLDLCGTKTATLEATVFPADTTEDLTWATSDKTVATVSNGVVTAKKVGVAKITAKAGEQSAICVVTVSCSHKGGEATCLDKAVCEVCGASYGDRNDHEFDDYFWDYDKDYHWQLCVNCMVETTNKGEHVYDDSEDTICDVCQNWRMPVPSGIKISNVASSGKPKITWSKFAEADAAHLAGYEVYRAESKNGEYVRLGRTTSNSYTDKTAEAGIQYYYKVKALGTYIGDSALSAAVTRTCDLPQPEIEVTNVASTGKNKITWEKVEGATEYKVYRATSKDGTYKRIYTTTGTSCTNSSAEAGKLYYYKVIAIHSNSAANSAYSEIVSRRCDLPRPTAKVTLNSKGKPVVSWAKVDGAVKYTVYIYNADGELVKTATTTNLKQTHSSAVKGNTYSYRVVAVHSNTTANSAKSTAVSIKSK